MLEKLVLLFTAYYAPQSTTIVELKQPVQQQEQIVYQHAMRQQEEEIKSKYDRVIEELKTDNAALTQENKKLVCELKAARKSALLYGALGATTVISTLAVQCAFGFIEPQHTATFKGILIDGLVAAGCGYLWSLVGCMHNPKSLSDTTMYRSKIIPSYCAAFGGLISTIALGNAFVTTKGYNHALLCGGLMMMVPLGVSATFHWRHKRGDDHVQKACTHSNIAVYNKGDVDHCASKRSDK